MERPEPPHTADSAENAATQQKPGRNTSHADPTSYPSAGSVWSPTTGRDHLQGADTVIVPG